MKCHSCAAELNIKSPVCPYCGCRNNLDLKGIHDYTIHKPETERTCPHCDIPLQTINISAGEINFYIEQCDRCFGLFFDPGELEAIMDESARHSLSVDHHKLNALNLEHGFESEVMYKRCPVCKEFMNRKNFGTKSGVIYDVCTPHGIWLDGGELKRLLAWKRAGGQLLHEERKEEERIREAKREEERKKKRSSFMRGIPAYEERSENFYTSPIARKSDSQLGNLIDSFLGELFS